MRSVQVFIAGKPVEVFPIKSFLNPSGSNVVIHFLDILSEYEKETAPKGIERIESLWQTALLKAKKFGGREFHNESFGGGIFLPYHINEIEKLTSLFE